MSLTVPDYLQGRIEAMVNDMEHKALYESNWATILRIPPIPDGNQWCVLYGPNLQEGVAGYGDTPWQAMQAFHAAMLSEKLPSFRNRGSGGAER